VRQCKRSIVICIDPDIAGRRSYCLRLAVQPRIEHRGGVALVILHNWRMSVRWRKRPNPDADTSPWARRLVTGTTGIHQGVAPL
jgi:hypothetical protein